MKKSKYLEVILPSKLERKLERSINIILIFSLLTLIESVFLITTISKQIYNQFVGVDSTSLLFSYMIIALIISYIVLYLNLNKVINPARTKSDSLYILLYMLSKFTNENKIGFIKKVKNHFIVNQINIKLSKIKSNLNDVFVPLKITDTEAVINYIQKSLIHINRIELNEINNDKINNFLSSVINLYEYNLLKNMDIALVNLNDRLITETTFTDIIKEFNINHETIVSIKEVRHSKELLKSFSLYKNLLLALITVFTISLSALLWYDDDVLAKVGSVSGIFGIYFIIFQIIKNYKN